MYPATLKATPSCDCLLLRLPRQMLSPQREKKKVMWLLQWWLLVPSS